MDKLNPYQIGIGGFVVVALYVIILAFMWRALSARFAGSDSDKLQTLGAAMGSTL